jgi:hypothetical protein
LDGELALPATGNREVRKYDGLIQSVYRCESEYIVAFGGNVAKRNDVPVGPCRNRNQTAMNYYEVTAALAVRLAN